MVFRQKRLKIIKISLKILAVSLVIIASNLFLQWCQNDLSLNLAFKFAFSWHTQKFFLGCLVLLLVYGFIAGLAGSLLVGGLFYSVLIGILGFADYLKMSYRQEPIYPDDLKMVTQFDLLHEMVGTGPFVVAIVAALSAFGLLGWSIYRSRKLTKKQQTWRVIAWVSCLFGLVYTTNFNQEHNLLRKAYDQTALWIPYSQKMNYYNTGFIGGFLFNLGVEAMNEPAGYSQAAVSKVTQKYEKIASKSNQQHLSDAAPNIVYIMSESFSDPSALKGITVTGDPLQAYHELANETISGKMLSQNYGGGTANIEFEALTGFSMEPLNPQMTTPYTMLVPKLKKIPSLVSYLEGQGYQTTAIHPYDTSMYKRRDVYNLLGFQEFLNQDTMQYTDKIENNPYISDAAAYHEVLDLLQEQKKPQFVHLVTMQTHMPYNGKYQNIPYQVQGDTDQTSLQNYVQDIAYSSEALKHFIAELEKLPKRTVVVFWGDHLPGIYSDAVKAQNEENTLHQTEFLMIDSQKNFAKETVDVTSPVYFAPDLLRNSQQPVSGFYELLLTLQQKLPAFEKAYYYDGDQWHSELPLEDQALAVYRDYQMIQYDILQGKQYSLTQDFFKEPEDGI